MRVLFVPVSSKKGIGEYMRSLILAEAIEREWPEAQIHFALSQEAPYVDSCPYPTLVTKRSPTHHVTEVNQYITDIKPEVVIFDASGRAAQIKHAKQSGAITVFIAQHDKKIRKGMRLSRLFYTDLFWIAQPTYTVSKLNKLQKLKLRLLNKTNPIYLGCIFSPPTPAQEDSFLASLNLEKQSYVFVSAGSGGHFMQDGSLAAEGFHQALSHSYNTSQIVQVWGNNYPHEIPKNNNEINLQAVKNTEFISLLKNAKYALINGGDTLLQALALQVPFVAVPVSADQPHRIKVAKARSSCFLAADAEVKSIIEQINKIEKAECRSELQRLLLSERLVENGYLSAVESLKIIYNAKAH